jgi:hypothetical protein
MYNDPEDPNNPDHAEWPSMGLLRNDMGTYGGPARTLLPDIQTGITEQPNRVNRYPVSFYNTPNPFNRSTDIRYQITDNRQKYTLRIYDTSGRLVRDLSKQLSRIGYQSSVSWDGRDDQNRILGGGVYICRIEAGDYQQHIRMILLR